MERVAELARARSQALVGVARREGLTPDEALEAVQEAFHTFLAQPALESSLARLSADPSGAQAYLATMVQNAARNLRRRHHRAQAHQPLDEAADLADQGPSVDELLAASAERDQLIGCVARLEEVQRQIVSLRILEEVSGIDVARALGLTPGHVAVLLHRAKRELAACMTGCPHGSSDCACAASTVDP